MIQVIFNKSEDGVCDGFRVSGHAGYDEYGYDIVCSAVSVLVINTINSIEQFTEDGFQVNQDEKQGLIEFHFVSDISEESVLLIKSLHLGLKGIADSYGNQYIQIRD